MKQKNNENMVSVLDYMYKSGISVKKGIERLAKVYCWPNVPTTADKDKYEFRALIEFVIFKEFVIYPFFKAFLSCLHSMKPVYLYKHLSISLKEKTKMLTYKEAYHLMRGFGVYSVKQILEQISCPSNVYNKIIRSLEEDNYDMFFSALDNSDYTKMMQVLWMMRYLKYGEFPSRVDYFRKYFCVYPDDDEDNFIDNRVIGIVNERVIGIVNKHSKRNGKVILEDFFLDNFKEDNKKELGRLFEESLFKSQWKGLYDCNLEQRASEYVEYDAKLILTRNVIIHKDDVMEKYGIDSSEVYDEFIDSDAYENNTINCEKFGIYILYWTDKIHYLYETVKDLLPEDIKSSIKELFDRCPKRDDEPCVIDDYSITKNKEYIRVRNSKIKGSTREEKEKNYKKSLEILYNVLVENDYICSETDKELFIYRFSGYGNPKRPLKKIKWNKKNVLLGHIVRCLISDKANTPKDSGIIATFFETESGKTINLSTAKHILVADFDKEKSNIDQNFVEAVEILRRCGFVDVEYTSKRR